MKQDVSISQTMEEILKQLYGTLDLSKPQNTSADEVIRSGVAQLFGSTDARTVFYQATRNSIERQRIKIVGSPKNNPWVTTRIQGDMFNPVPIDTPSVLMNGEELIRYYDKGFVLVYLEWIRNRRDSQTKERRALKDAFDRKAIEEARSEAIIERLEEIVKVAVANNLDPRSLCFEKTQKN